MASELVTIGTLGALALSTAADAIIKGAVGEAVKDAYQALKKLLIQNAPADISALETAPNSAGRQAIVGEVIDALPLNERDEISALVNRLIAALEDEGSRGTVGIDIGRLKAKTLTLDSLQVSSGIGLKASDIDVAEDMKIGPVTVGNATGKKAQ